MIFFRPSQKSPIPLNRYDDFVDESPQPPRSRTPEPKLVARALYNFVGQTSRYETLIIVSSRIDPKHCITGHNNIL